MIIIDECTYNDKNAKGVEMKSKIYIDTEQKIKDCYISLITKDPNIEISITDICQKANVHRTTFYGHYDNIRQLDDDIMNDVTKTMENIFESKGNTIRNVLLYARDNKDLINYYVNKNSNKYRDIFANTTIEKYIHNFTKRIGYENALEKKYNEAFYQSGVSTIIMVWIHDNCEDPIEKIEEIINKNIQRLID